MDARQSDGEVTRKITRQLFFSHEIFCGHSSSKQPFLESLRNLANQFKALGASFLVLSSLEYLFSYLLSFLETHPSYPSLIIVSRPP